MSVEPVQLTMNPSTVKLAGFLLDKYGAPKLSELTVSDVPFLEEPPNYLGSFVLNSIFITGTHPDPMGRVIFMFGRRVDQAVREYINGRGLLSAYVERLAQTNTPFLLAMRAATHFEQCVASVCQAGSLLNRINQLAGSPEESTEPQDNREDRLRRIWNRSKHFDDDLGGKRLTDAEVTAPVWLTNHGISSTKASISFVELHSLLTEPLESLKFLSEDLPNQITEGRRAAGKTSE